MDKPYQLASCSSPPLGWEKGADFTDEVLSEIVKVAEFIKSWPLGALFSMSV